MLDIHINNKYVFKIDEYNTKTQIYNEILEKSGIQGDLFYLTNNGQLLLEDTTNICNTVVNVVPKLLGGKGGFGSMLRAIGAQIEKTTNREACRDLSGRRLRDINEEKRLKNWIDQQVEREQEAVEKKQKKLERLCQRPKHEFKDEHYDKERSELPERLEDAIEQGLKAEASSSGSKRKAAVTDSKLKKKKKMWMDEDLDSDVSSSEDEDASSSDQAPSSSTGKVIECADSSSALTTSSHSEENGTDCEVTSSEDVKKVACN